LFFFFFFSSRRRHTRCLSDWSSDVCSSDLKTRAYLAPLSRRARSATQYTLRTCTRKLRWPDVRVRLFQQSRPIRSARNSADNTRSEERRVGKEWRTQWARERCIEE